MEFMLIRFTHRVVLVGLALFGWSLWGPPQVAAQPEEPPPEKFTLPENPPQPPPPPPVWGEVPAPFFGPEGRGRPELIERFQQRFGGRPEGGPEKARIFALKEETQAALGEAQGLEALPGLRLARIRDRLIVAGPAALVDAATQVLAALDPALRPRRVAGQARVYLGSKEPARVPPAPEDPLLPRLREQFAYEHLTLLAAPIWQGVDGNPVTTEMEGTLAPDEAAFMRLEFSALPQVWEPDQVSLTLKLKAQLKEVLPGTGAEYALETTLRGAAGETFLLAAPDALTGSALICVVTMGVEEEKGIEPGEEK